jgi:hypothetical protein
MIVFWDDAQCTLVDINRRFSEVGNLSYLPMKVKEEIKIHVLKLEKYVFRPTPTNFLCLSYHVSVSPNLGYRRRKGKGKTKLGFTLLSKKLPKPKKETALGSATRIAKSQLETRFRVVAP